MTPAAHRGRPKVRRGGGVTSGAKGRSASARHRGRPVPRTSHRPVARESLEEIERLSRELAWTRPVEAAAPKSAPEVATHRLHIVMVGWEFPPHHTGGLGVHCYELTKELTLMGHRITFLTPFAGPFTPVEGVAFRHPGDRPEDEEQYPPAYWSGTPRSSQFGEAIEEYNRWVADLAEVERVDVVHVHDWFGTVGADRLARRLGVPLVMTVHSTEYDRSLGHPWERILSREQHGVRAADIVIAVSRHLRQQLIDRYRARPGKVRVVYNAVRPNDRLAPLEESKQTVLYLGRLAAMKGVDTFLRAAARAAPASPGALFVVAGEGPEFPRLVNLAVHLGIGDRVLFLGHVTEEERSVLLASASVFVFPSVVEPFGIAALEAMAAGVPVILSKTSGVAEIASSVFAVDFWDSEEFASRIIELLNYPVLRKAMGSGGRWDALRKGWPERAIETVGVYAELLQSRRVGR